MINPNSYYTVQGWMVNELDLKGNALIVYAIIYGFSQDGTSEYSGSARYLAEWLGCSRSTIMVTLKMLTEKGYLTKRDIYKNGTAYCAYSTTARGCPKTGQGVQNTDRGVSENRTGGVQNSDSGCPKTGHNNSSDKNSDIDRKKESAPAEPPAPPAPPVEEKKEPVKHKYGEYRNVLLTDEEYGKLQQLFPNDLQERIERLSEYMASKGAKYKSHYATIRSWANRDKKQTAAGRGGRPGPVGPNGIALDPTKNDVAAIF